MTAAQLKASILDLAIRGKLVVQDPSDEPAEKLLERIWREKNSRGERVERGEVSDEEKPFELPKGWAWVRWGDLSDSIQYGYNAPAKPKGRIRMVRISDVQDGEVQWIGVPFCDIPEGEIEKYLLRPGDILFARTGGTVGKSYIVKDVPEPAIYAGYLIRTRYDQSLCADYFKYFMESQLYWAQLREGTIATAQPNCNGKTLSAMLLPLPPLAEQKRIVAKIEELMPLVKRYEAAEQKRVKLDGEIAAKMKASLLDQAIRGKLVAQDPGDEPAAKLLKRIWREKNSRGERVERGEVSDEEKPFELPNGWAWCRLGDVFQHNTGKALNRGSKEHGSLCEYITTSNLYWGRFDFTEVRKMYFKDEELDKCTVRKGDLLVCEGGDVGRAAIWPYDKSICIQNHIHRLRPKIELHILFFYFVLMYYKIAKLIGGKGIGIEGLSSNALGRLPIPLPPLAEQKRIVAKIEELMPLVDRVARVKGG